MTLPVEHERVMTAVSEGPLHAAGKIVPDDWEKDPHVSLMGWRQQACALQGYNHRIHRSDRTAKRLLLGAPDPVALAMSFTIVAPYRESDSYRRRNLERFLEWNTERFPDAEILIIEQSDSFALQERHRGAKVLRQKWHGLFNRSWALNAGVRHATHEHLILTDCDLLIEKPLVVKALDRLHVGAWYAQLAGYVFDLTREASDYFTSQSAYNESLPSTGKRTLTFCSAGACATTKHAVSFVGWMDEGFQGWGGEDEEYLYRVLLLVEGRKLVRCSDRGITHLWHPLTARNNPMHAANVKRIWSRRRWTGVTMRAFLERNDPALLGSLQAPLLTFGDPP